ncbi:hypothetical protein LEP1GSC115_3396 [Leptospira interrogans serovar Australis str. 200703203]|uniref:Uncharacterized protein n=1 Tax=Leptospira interrogans serovar Australis str. 200703203 TaxID=1085541 RepID=N1UQ78_LEPIR|nr:hypothetical protein LEP1GSC115_3396 [Leptospira interrogans serovar Australis str. 200703203]
MSFVFQSISGNLCSGFLVFLSNRIETFLKEREQDKFYFHYDSKIKF